MRMMIIALMLAAFSSLTAGAAEDENRRGYRNCNLDHLEACQNSNQLFFGPFGKDPAPRKHRITTALNQFLRGAPKTHLAGYSFDIGRSVAGQFVGPSGAPEHLPGGEWLFAGFEPHASPYSAYVMFDKNGRILLVATLDSTTDGNSSVRSKFEDYTLRIYSRSGEPRPDIVAEWQGWARKAVGEQSNYPGILAPNRMFGTEIFVADGNRWSSHWLK